MTKPLLITSLLLASLFSNSQVNFSITNHTGSWSITCSHPSIALSVQANVPQIQFSWDGPQGNVSTSSVAVIASAGIYTVTGSGPATNMSQTFAIGVNTVAPTSLVSPIFQNVTCNQSSFTTVTLTAQSPIQNISHNIASPFGGSSQFTSGIVQFHPGGPGTYSYCLTDLSNGCSSCKEFTVASAAGFPTFSLQSPQGFTLGCGTKSCATIVIANPQTQPPANPMSFTFVTQNMTYPGTGPLSMSLTHTVCGAETWTAVARDNTTDCESKSVFTVIADTVPPETIISTYTKTLTCYQSKTAINVTSKSPSSFTWFGAGSTTAGSSLSVAVNYAAPTSTLIDQFTLSATGNHNQCVFSTVIPVYQNIFSPIASFSGSLLNCFNPTITLVNTSSTTIPAGVFTNTAPVTIVTWYGPAPQTPMAMSNTYTAYTPGLYTITVLDENNGCSHIIAKNIVADFDYPMGTANPPSPDPICFSGEPLVLAAPITGDQTHVVYGWFQPPGGGTLSIQSPTILASVPGLYTSSASDTLNGCGSVVVISVVNCVSLYEFSSSPVRVFPNPAHSEINLESYGRFSYYLIKSSDGKQVLSGKISGERIDISQLPAGMYIFEIFDEQTGRIFPCKLVKE